MYKTEKVDGLTSPLNMDFVFHKTPSFRCINSRIQTVYCVNDLKNVKGV